MWMSVPQIAARLTLMSTSLCPGFGRGISSSQMPGSGFDLTSARMPPSGDHAELAADCRERVDGPVELGARQSRRHLGADARLAFGHDGIGEADHVDAVVEQPVR